MAAAGRYCGISLWGEADLEAGGHEPAARLAAYQCRALRWKRYEKQRPGHQLQVDVKFIEGLLASRGCGAAVLQVRRDRRLPRSGRGGLPRLIVQLAPARRRRGRRCGAASHRGISCDEVSDAAAAILLVRVLRAQVETAISSVAPIDDDLATRPRGSWPGHYPSEVVRVLRR